MNWGGLDTETQDGKAVLIGTDRDHLLFPKSFAAIVAFLMNDGRKDFAAYNVAYDARAMLHFLPLRHIARLNRTLETVLEDGTEVRYVPRKLLELAQGVGKKKRTVRIWDTWVFYGGSLEKTASKVLGESKAEIPKSWLSRMGPELRGSNRGTIVRYCQRDADLARRLHDHLKTSFGGMGLAVKMPYSPGSYAVEYFRDDIPVPPPDWVQDVFREAFYGGRIEIFKRGRLAPAYLYDIKSAYPHAAAGMFSTDGCQWVEVEEGHWPSGKALYGAYKVRVTVPLDAHIPLFPLRARDGSISYPCGTFTTWSDKETLDYCGTLAKQGYDYRTLYGVECHPEGKPTRCYSAVKTLFKVRKAKPELDLPAKLILNSLYGKLASTRDRWEETEEPSEKSKLEDGVYYNHKEEYSHVTNFAQAGAITARTRIRLHKAAQLDPKSVAAFATDGIVATRPLPLALGKDLGCWTTPERWDSAVLVLAGVGCYRRGVERKQVVRGMRLNQSLDDLLGDGDSSPVVSFLQCVAVGIAEYLRKKDKRTFNALMENVKRLDVNADSKRAWPRPWKTASEVLRRSQDSKALVRVEE